MYMKIILYPKLYLIIIAVQDHGVSYDVELPLIR